MSARLIIGTLSYSLLCQSLAKLHPLHSSAHFGHFPYPRLSHLSFLRRAYAAARTPSKMFQNIIKNPCAEVLIVPVLSDNYSYILVDPETKKSFCVDPAEPAKVVSAASEKGVTLSASFCTHKHYDHSGGNGEIQRMIPGIKVYGSSYEAVPGLTDTLVHGQTLKFGNLEIRCIKAACHTLGHMLYYVTNPANPHLQPVLFTGDTVFIGGCGRFFEGDAKMMLEILNSIRELRADSLVYCGHEYTVRNLEFARTVDPAKAVTEKLDWAQGARKMGLPTVPSLLKEEYDYNPFFRAAQLLDSLKEETEESALATLRRKKDRF